MRTASHSIATLALTIVALGWLPACSPPQSDAPTVAALDPAFREEVRLRAVTGFARGWAASPGGEFSEDESFTMAPQLIQATVGAAPYASPMRMGTVSQGADGRLFVDATRPAVYVSRATAHIGGREHDQWSYLWWNAVSKVDPRLAGRQGIRVTLDASGSPFLWEVLTDTSGTRLLFADRVLEEAASREFGPPSPGRDLTLARTLEETPDVLIVRLLDAGVTPQGPIVYIGEDGRDVQTLLCRCMDSEVAEIVGEEEYDLLPIEALAAMGVDARFDTAPDELETLMNLPTGPDADVESGE